MTYRESAAKSQSFNKVTFEDGHLALQATFYCCFSVNALHHHVKVKKIGDIVIGKQLQFCRNISDTVVLEMRQLTLPRA